MPDLKVLLISTYELGRQPFGLASPAAWLRADGFQTTSLDLSRQSLDEEAVRTASLIAFYLPMHTATRIAVRALERVRKLNPSAHLCGFGLYAPVNAGLLRRLGVGTTAGDCRGSLMDLVGDRGLCGFSQVGTESRRVESAFSRTNPVNECYRLFTTPMEISVDVGVQWP